MHLICWTNDHFIKTHWNFRRETRFSRVRIFRNFRISRFLDFWPLHPIQLFARIFTVATRNCFDEANDGLCPNYINIFFFFFVFFSIFGLLTIVSYTAFLRGFSLWQRGIVSTKQMMVCDQITLYINFSICYFFFFWFCWCKT